MKQKKSSPASPMAGEKISQNNYSDAPCPSFENQLYSELIAMSHDAMIVCDPQQHIQLWNDSAEQLYGWSAQEAIGHSYHELLQSKASNKDPDSMFRLLKEDQWEGELIQARHDGTRIVVKSRQHIHKDQNNYPEHILITNQDITAEKYVEQQDDSTAGNQTSDHHPHTILESLKDAFFLLDKHWRITYVNQQAAELINLSEENLVGHNIWEKVPGLKGTIFEEKAYEAMQSQKSIQFEAFFPPKRHWYDVRCHPIPEGLSISYSDITVYKRTEIALRASEHKFKSMIDANIIGFTLTELDGQVIEANDKLLDMLGYTHKDLKTGKLNWRDFTPSEYIDIDNQAVKDLIETGAFMPVEKEYCHRQGQRVPILIAGSMVEGTRPMCATIIIDLTSQKELEKQKEMFMSIVGHELRTPLTAINGSIQLAQRRIQHFLQDRPEKLPSDVEVMIGKLCKLLEQSLRHTRVQNRLINDMLDVSRLAVDKLEMFMQPGNLISVIEETVEDLRYTEGNHPIYLVLPEQRFLPVLIDSDRISQVVANYVTNALKYSGPEIPVTVEVTVNDGEARVWVHDRGKGMTKEEQKHIWDRYYRGKNAKNQPGGGVNLGLGLHICQILIERHHGQVGVVSKKNKGASFWFSLPLAQASL